MPPWRRIDGTDGLARGAARGRGGSGPAPWRRGPGGPAPGARLRRRPWPSGHRASWLRAKPRRRVRRWVAAPLLAAIATVAAWSAPRVALRLAAPTPVLQGTTAAAWSGPAAFVHPGADVGAPTAGRITAVAPEGLVAAGAPLVAVSASPPGPRAAPLLPAWARWNGLPAGAAAGAALYPLSAAPGAVATRALQVARYPGPFCLGPRCDRTAAAVGAGGAGAAGGGGAPGTTASGGGSTSLNGAGPAHPAGPSGASSSGAAGPAARLVRAGQAGWFYPGVDPLAALSASALGDLAPGAVRDPLAATRVGERVTAGVPIGELGAPWSGLWLVALPETALPAVSAGGGALEVGWGGGPAGAARPATLVAAGPDDDGRFLAVLAPSGAGPEPGPPARTEAVVRLPHAAGEIVPATALRAGPAVVVLGPASDPGRARRAGVQILSRGARTAVVEGIPPGDRVLARPGWMAPWVAGASSPPAEIPPEGPRG